MELKLPYKRKRFIEPISTEAVSSCVPNLWVRSGLQLHLLGSKPVVRVRDQQQVPLGKGERGSSDKIKTKTDFVIISYKATSAYLHVG